MKESYKEYKHGVIKKYKGKGKEISFDKIDDRLYYVYRISNTKLNKHYYGSRVSSIIDIGYKYFSSSRDKEFKQDQRDNPQDYKYKVLRIFDNTKDKEIYESYLHQFFNVKYNERFYNKANQTPYGYDTTGISPTNIITYFIYDNTDKLKHTVIGNIHSFCKEFNLPPFYIQQSLQNNGSRIYVTKYDYRWNKIKKYIGWYCLKEGQIKCEDDNNYILNRDKIGLEKKIKAKQNYSKCKTGKNHSNFKKRYIHIPKLDKIIIFDKNSKFNSFKAYLKYHNMPILLLDSARYKGKPIYLDLRSATIAKKNGYEDYIGSFVVYENQIQDKLFTNIKEYKDILKEKHYIASRAGAKANKTKYQKVENNSLLFCF